MLLLLGCGNFPQIGAGNGINGVEFSGVPLVCFLVLIIWGIFLYILNLLINRIGSKLGDVEGISLGGVVGSDSCVCTLGGCKNGSTLGADADMLVISSG